MGHGNRATEVGELDSAAIDWTRALLPKPTATGRLAMPCLPARLPFAPAAEQAGCSPWRQVHNHAEGAGLAVDRRHGHSLHPSREGATEVDLRGGLGKAGSRPLLGRSADSTSCALHAHLVAPETPDELCGHKERHLGPSLLPRLLSCSSRCPAISATLGCDHERQQPPAG